MTPLQLKTFFEKLIGDTLDDAETWMLMDQAYTIVNEERAWRMLMKLSTAITHSPGDTWATTSGKTLPSDFSSIYKLFGGNADNEYTGVKFEELPFMQNSANRYAVDLEGLTLRLTGSPSEALTMYLFYQKFPPTLVGMESSEADQNSATKIVWPTRFRPIIAYKMAEIFNGNIDADEMTRQMTPFHEKTYKELKRAMVAWNTRAMMSGMDWSSAGSRPGGKASNANVVDMDD